MDRKRRASVRVDENALREMISDNTPNWEELAGERPGEENTGAVEKEPPVEYPVNDTPAPVVTPPGGTADTAKPRKRKEPKDYSGMFLGKRASAVKKQTYIGAAQFNKITKIMSVIAHDITLPTFLDNVLDHHLETYRDEIKELYEIETKNPF